MDMKIPMVAISAAIVVIVLASVLMPVLGDATETEKTFTNEGYYRMSEITSDTSLVISWTYEDPTNITVGDATVSMDKVPVGTTVTIVGGNDYVIRYLNNGATSKWIQGYDSNGVSTAKSESSQSCTITISGLSVSASIGGGTRSGTLNDGYHIDPNGPFIMKDKDKGAYVKTDDSLIVFSGLTGTVKVFATGTIDDGMDFAAIENTTFGDVTFNYTEDPKYTNLVSLTTCTFDITVSGTTTAATYSYYLVPYEVTAERAIHLDPNEIAILGAIPALVIVALLIGVLALYMKSRMD